MVFYTSLKNQDWLIPPRIEDIIEDEHVCNIVEIVVDNIDFSEIEKSQEGPGHPMYHPRIYIKIIVMGMIDGVRSSRKLEKQVKENVVYMYLAEKLQPDFRSISDFRKDHPELIEDCFKAVVEFARDLGMVRLGHLSIDGTKIKANASNSKTLSKDDLSFLEEIIKNEIQKGIEIDKVEDERHGKSKNGYELPKDIKSIENIKKYLREKIKETKFKTKNERTMAKMLKEYIDGDETKKDVIDAKIKNAKEELEKSGGNTVNLTDPSSKFMKNKKGRIEQSYNGQIAVDSEQKIIIANDVSQAPADTEELQPMIENIEKNVGELPEGTEMSLDNGYYSGPNLKHLEDKKFDGYMPDSNQAQENKGKAVETKQFSKECFEYDVDKDVFRCPNGKELGFAYEYYDKTHQKTIREYRCHDCDVCPFKSQCIKERGKNYKRIKVDKYEEYRKRMSDKMKSKEGREKLKIRSKIVEHPFGDIKQNIGLREFLTRGLDKVKIEFNLSCIAHNIKRIASFIREKYSNVKNFLKTATIKIESHC